MTEVTEVTKAALVTLVTCVTLVTAIQRSRPAPLLQKPRHPNRQRRVIATDRSFSGLAIFRGEIVQMFAAVVAGSVPIIAQLQSAFASPMLALGKAKLAKKGPTLAQAKEINAFLASVERRAFKHAAYAVRDDDNAMDIVQDSMMKLTESYSDKPANELPMLFTRILQNTILDHFRRTKTRNQYTTNFSSLGGANADDDFDVLEILESQDSAIGKDQPLAALEQVEAMGAIEAALTKLPPRQREAFLLRYWEDMDTAETAATMGCSEGSVKTHCSRAVHALQGLLRQKGITL